MLKLGVNIDHVATLRQVRGTSYPDVLEAAESCESAGAHGVTVHLREDRRHIQTEDVYALKENLKIKLNLEMANSPKIVDIAVDLCPDEVCLVPEKREELTTEGGLDVASHKKELEPTVALLKKHGIIVSLFIDPDNRQVAAAAELGVPYIELHTGTLCNSSRTDESDRELRRLIDSAVFANRAGLKVNAGHGINLDTIMMIMKIPFLDTLNIGHSIVARAVFTGLENAIKEMLERMACYDGGMQ